MRPAAAFIFVLLLASSAPAAPRISIAPFTGTGANAARSQLVTALCEIASCVGQAKVTTRGRPDWKKAKRLNVSHIITGKLSRSRGKETLEVRVLKAPGRLKLRKRYTVSRGRLSENALVNAATAILEAAGGDVGGEDEPEHAPVAQRRSEPVDEVEPDSYASTASTLATESAAEPEPRLAAKGARSSSVSLRARESSRGVESSPPIAETRRRHEPASTRPLAQPLALIEVGPNFLTRRLTYDRNTTENLRSYQAGFIFIPQLRGEIYPLTLTMTGPATGLGLEAGYAFAIGLRSRRANGPNHPTSLTRFDVALRYRFQPVETLPAVFSPFAGFRHTSFSVAAAPDGSVIDGLPDIAYSSMALGLAAEASFSEGFLTPFVRFAYLPVLSSGEIISETYFPRGSASGLDIAFGAGFRLIPNLQLRVAGQITSYGLSFQTQEEDPYQAAGAVDQYLGVTTSFQYRF